MSLIEQSLYKCIQLSESSKSSERKKAISEIHLMLNDQEAVKILNQNSDDNAVNWNNLFHAAHRSLINETQKYIEDDTKKPPTTSTITSRDNVKSKFGAVVWKIVDIGQKIKSDTLMSACLRIFENSVFWNSYQTYYINILRYVLTSRKYWVAIKTNHWAGLLKHLPLLLKRKNNLTKWVKKELLMCLELVVKLGCQQSYLGLEVKQQLIQFLEEEFHHLYDHPSCEIALLSLIIRVCEEICKESRTGVCHLGEALISGVINLFDHKCNEDSTKNSLIFSFLLLQVKFHHPEGSRQGSGAAYACDWNTWNDHLSAMHRLVINKLQSTGLHRSISPMLLDLCGVLCNQLFENESLNYDITLAMNETCPTPKKRKISMGIQGIMDELTLCGKDSLSWPWLKVISVILSKYPLLFKDSDLSQLLNYLWKLQCTSKDAKVIKSTYECCTLLIDVMDDRKVKATMWLKIWETTLRTAGLNQNEAESHSLLRALLRKMVAPPSGLENLLKMFQSRMIRISDHSLKTLACLLSYLQLPETPENCDSFILLQPWEQPLGAVRLVLLDWLFPSNSPVDATSNTPALSSYILAKLFTMLTLKIKIEKEINLTKSFSAPVLSKTSFEKNYAISAFESGLASDYEKSEHFVTQDSEKLSEFPSNVVDKRIQQRLFDLLIDRFLYLEGQCNGPLVEDPASSQLPANLKTKVDTSMLIVYHVSLVIHVLSNMILYGTIKEDSLKNCELVEPLVRSLINLGKLTEEILQFSVKISESNQDNRINFENAKKLLSALEEVYGAQISGPVCLLLREITPNEVLIPVVNLFSLEQLSITQEIIYEDISDNQSSEENIEVNKVPEIMDNTQFNKLDHVHSLCVNLLKVYSCPPLNITPFCKQSSVLERLLKCLYDYLDVSRPASFITIIHCLHCVLKCPYLDKDRHVSKILTIMQSLCRHWNQDAEASSYILLILSSLLKQVAKYGKYECVANITLIFPFMKKQFGPDFTLQLINVFESIIQVDKYAKWTRWACGKIPNLLIDEGELPSEAAKIFKDEKNNTAMAEDLAFFFKSPFHEVRLAAVKAIGKLFRKRTSEFLWELTFFHRICAVVNSLFMVEVEKLNVEEKMDESVNRTASVLHMLCIIIGSSNQCSNQALLCLLKLTKEKNLDLDLVNKAIGMIPSATEIKSSKEFLLRNLPGLLDAWIYNKFLLQEFPFKLFGFPTLPAFYESCLDCILPVVFRYEKMDLCDIISTDLKRTVPDILQTAFPAILAQYVPFIRNDSASSLKMQQQYKSFIGLLGGETITHLLSSQIQCVLVRLLQNVQDAPLCENLLGLKYVLLNPQGLSISFEKLLSAMKNLQDLSGTDMKLLVYVGTHRPSVIQQVLLQLRIDTCAPVMLHQKLLSLHQYCTFCEVLATSLQRGELSNIAEFIVRDVAHTLLLLIHEYQCDASLVDISYAACRYLKIFFEHILPLHSEVVSHLLPTITGVMVPLIQNEGHLAESSLAVLELIVINHNGTLSQAIGQLPPFPETPVFNKMSEIHSKAKYKSRVFTLEEEIVHFLGSAKKNASFMDWGCMLEGLRFIRKQLSEKRNDLLTLYMKLEKMNSFTECYDESVLHQLVCTLIYLGSSSNPEIQLEVARCLGKLGPADLTTLVLKPAEDCVKLASSTTDPHVLFLTSVSCLLADCLTDADVHVVKAASAALYGVLSSPKAEALVGSKNEILDLKKVSPFIPIKGTKKKSAGRQGRLKILAMLSRDEIWCPKEDTTHEAWITTLVSEFLQCLSDEDPCIRLLIPVASVKITCAESMLPVLMNFALCYSEDAREQICNQISKFFFNHCECAVSVEPSQMSLSGIATNVYLNKVSVQCMMNAVNFIHVYKTVAKHDNISFNLNYLHIARAAQFCSAYFSSIMFAELWCSDDERWNLKLSGCASVCLLDQICENTENDGEILQTLLRNAYKHIGDHDAVYGCGSSMLLNPATRVKHYEHLGMWNQVLLDYDMTMSSASCTQATAGLVRAMQNCGLYYLMNTFLGASISEQTDQLQPFQLECMWRLGQWGSITPAKNGNDFEWSRFSALKSLHDGDQIAAIKTVKDGQHAILTELTISSLESCNNIYLGLAALQALQEIEDVVSCGDLNDAISKWSYQTLLPQSDFLLFESLAAQRLRIMRSLRSQSSLSQNANFKGKFPPEGLIDMCLATAKLAREEGKVELAELWLHSVSSLTTLPKHFIWELRLEEAQLTWSRGKGAVDSEYNSIACQQLRSLLKDLKSSSNASPSSEFKVNLHAHALNLFGTWMAESRSETPQLIIEKYMKEALSILNQSETNYTEKTRLEAHYCLARFADLEYQRLAAYIKSESFQQKQLVMEKLKETESQYQVQSSTIDQEEIRNTLAERIQFVELALQHYLEALIIGEKDENLSVFRLVSLWIENSAFNNVLKLVESQINNIPSHKFVVLLPQLAASVGDSEDGLNMTVNHLFERCAKEHPHHTLPLILALANSYKDRSNQNALSKSAIDGRVTAATRMLLKLRKNKNIGNIVIEMEKLALSLINFAYLPAEDKKIQSYVLSRKDLISQIQDLKHCMVPILSLPVRCDGRYNNVISIHSFERSFSVANGITRPKKILCLGSDGVKRPVLVKGRDDLRQDAVMQQVFTIMNTLLKKCKETNHRKLTIRTYKVVPLTQRCGILEWCEGTNPLGQILIRFHEKYYPGDYVVNTCQGKIKNARNTSNAERLRVFLDICQNVHPAFRFFFAEMYPTPAEWFEHRLAYIHSVSTNSMVGYILGLGDRHVNNILVDQNSAELIHIDFGIAFEFGHVLPTPETVPFRLTRDIEDGMGVSGIEGVFRRSSEKTMAVLRSNQETILTILEVLLYDPLYAWTTAPKSVVNRQRGSKSKLATEKSPEDSDSCKEKNKMAERALFRLKQKLQGTEEGPASSIEGQVNRLIQQARDPSNLSRLFCGWQAYL